MRDFLFTLDKNSRKSLQSQIREIMVSAILAGHMQPGSRLPSTRHLSKQLGVSRNTVVLVYQGLIDDGYLRTAERSGYFVNETVLEMGVHRAAKPATGPTGAGVAPVDWHVRLAKQPTLQRNISKPKDWRSLPYPFIYGQSDPTLFPISDWRDCVYKALGKKWLDFWSSDTLDVDDEMLVEQIRTRILPRRGILAGDNQILVTLGAQHALYLIASLLVRDGTHVVMEEPGYPDARNIFRLRTSKLTPIRVDKDGLPLTEAMLDADLVYTTPSHQLPTTVTMSTERRHALLKAAADNDFLVIEDDYELETNYLGRPLPALKSLDTDNRVMYVGSFSKTLFPGLRLGFLVAAPEFISEVRALRRLMVRHPPTNNQRTTAFFLSLGYYDVYIRRLNRAYKERWQEMADALQRFLPDSSHAPSFGGSSYWVEGPAGFDSERLQQTALRRGIFYEPGGVYFDARKAPVPHFRLGFSSIGKEKIGEGIRLLSDVIHESV